MNIELLDWLACPADGGHPLRLAGASPNGGAITEAQLVCPACGCVYPILDGIVSFLTTEQSPLSQLQELEHEARDREYRFGEVYLSEVARLPELDAIRSALGDCHGMHVLDAGCGDGKMSQPLRGAARIVAFDFSMQGLVANRLRALPEVDLVHGDVSRLPFRDKIFDVCLSAGIVQHLPSEQRTAFVRHIRRVLKPDGKLVLVTFNWNSYHRKAGAPKEGFFDNGIICHRFEVEDLRSVLATCFEVEAIVPVRIQLPKTYWLVTALGTMNVVWDRFWRKRAISYSYADVLLAQCRVRQ